MWNNELLNYIPKWKKLFAALTLPLLLALALALRLQSWYPFNAVDEDAILQMVWGLHADPFPPGMPPPFPGYPPLFMYLNYFLSLLFKEILVFLGVFASAGDYLSSPLARSITFKSGQIVVALLGTLHIAVVWKIGKEFFDKRVAWLAVLIIAFHPHLVLNSHIFKADGPLALFFALLLLYALRFMRSLETRDFLIACFIAGVTIACKYNGAVEALLIPIALLFVRKKLVPKRFWRLLFISPFFGILGFLVGAPNWLAHPIKNFLLSYRLAFFNFREYTFYDSFTSTYRLYAIDLWRTLGPVFVLLLMVGIVLIFLRRKREELVIFLSLFIYVLVQGSSNYYGTRVILPLYAGVALIIAKTVCLDIYPFIKKAVFRKAFTFAVFSGAALFCLGNIRDSIAQFNLWKSDSTWEEALSFRREHIPSAYSFGREMFTPIVGGDRGVWDISDISEHLFHGPQALPFLNTGLLTDTVFKRSRNKVVKNNFRMRLQGYRVFHKISKPQFSPWDGDILFWYHPQYPGFLTNRTGKIKVSLPRLFRRNGGTTLFYPLQTYEKDPGLFSLQGSYWGKWILSSQPLKTISLTLFCPEGDITANIKINASEVSLKASMGSAVKEITAPSPLLFHKSPCYRIEARLSGDHPDAFLLIQEVSPALPSETFQIASSLAGDLPGPFSAKRPPDWVMEFYRRTGIDLTLLSLTQEMVLWENPEYSLLPFESQWTVLPQGVFRWQVETEPLSKKVPTNDPPPLEILVFDGDRFATRSQTWEKLDDKRFAVIFQNPDERIFVKVKPGDFREKNLLLRHFSLRPDYLNSLRQGMIRRFL